MSDEHLLRLREIMQSLAARVPKIILQRVEEVYPALKESLQNFDAIKVEDDFLIKEKSIDVKSDKVCAPAASSIKEAEPKENDISIKVENDNVIEENSIDMETDEVDTPSACSINKVEPKQKNVSIKVEIDDVIEENSIVMETDEVYTPSACSINKVEPTQNSVSIKVENYDVIEENSIDMETDGVHTKLACSIKEVEPKICTILLKDVPGPSSETCNWVINVKVEEDPLAIAFPAVKAEPGNNLNEQLIHGDESLAHQTTLKDRQRTHSGAHSYSCDVCNKSFSNKKVLKVHQCIPSSGLPITCEVCGKSFRFKSVLRRHQPVHSEERPFTCDVCNKSFKRQADLQIHRHIHSREQPFSCEVCNKTFSRNCILKLHQRIHTGERPFACDVCNKPFRCQSSLWVHRRVHSEERPFSCDVCNKTFKWQRDMEIHQRIHSGEKPFCCEVCNRSFKLKAHLMIHHMRLHTGERPFSCDVCNKLFATKFDLKTHKRIHTGERPFACDICKKLFKAQNEWKSHLRVHSEERPFSCGLCNKSFKCQSDLKKHQKVCKGRKMSSISPSDEGLEGDGLAHCAEYVDSQSSRIVVKNEVCRKEAPVYDERCDSTDASDDSASVAPSAREKKRKARAIKLKEERLDLQCEWRDCDYRTGNLDHFVRHVSLHIPHLEVKMTDDQKGVYVCLWEQCGFESADSSEITRHVNFHSYHTKVKCIGSNILARSRLPACTLHCAGKNVVPDLPHAFACCWQTCEQTFNNSQTYFNHVEAHVYCNPRGRVVEGGIPCHWSGCMSNSVYPSICKLAEHVRTHTQEKLVGCPTCGGLFASRARFSYHCMHQVPSELRGYQFRYKKPVNNHLKCPFCDKTCSCPSNLSVHIRYRHLDSKPFKCSSCEYRAKTHHDLKVHWNTHRSDPLYRCKEEGCDFSCRSAYGLRRHCDRCHVGCDQPQYCCHICDSLFQRGSLLTRHLRKRHSICRPSGQCRFRYKQNGDGLFRLLTTDTETVKVTQKVMVLEASQPFCINEDDPLTQEAGGEILSS